MMNGQQDFENIFKDRFDSLNIEPSATSWTKINNKLRVKSFMRFSIKTFNIYTTSFLTSIAVVLSVIAINNSSSEDVILTDNTPVISEQPEVVNVIDEEEVVAEKVIEEEVKPVKDEEVFSAVFKVSETKGCAPLEVRFTNTINTKKYFWEFGDGETSDKKIPEHIYSEPGKYNAKLTITDEHEKTSMYDQSIIVYDKPVALFTIDPEGSVFDEKKVLFSNDSKDANSYIWHFGDNKSNSDKNAEHVYEKLGTYDVTLVAENKHGCADSVKTKISFLEDNCRIEFPSVFTPARKESGVRTEWFSPTFKGVDQYHLIITNQFGHTVFEANDVSQAWDGYYNGKIVPAGNYSWKVEGVFVNGQSFENQGNIKLTVKKIDNYDQY